MVLTEAASRIRVSCATSIYVDRSHGSGRLDYDFASRTLSWINQAIRARVGIAIDENATGVSGTIGLAAVNGVGAQQKHRALLHQHGLRPAVEDRIQRSRVLLQE